MRKEMSVHFSCEVRLRQAEIFVRIQIPDWRSRIRSGEIPAAEFIGSFVDFDYFEYRLDALSRIRMPDVIQADWDCRKERMALRSTCKEPAAVGKKGGRL
jgi:hypothetical protein